jgi:FAD:protein FMN transferase
MLKKEFRAMGCRISVMLDSDESDAITVLDEVPNWFETWEQSLSRFRMDSELSRVNQNPEIWQPVSQTFWQVLHAAREMEQYSSNLVTPVILPALERAGYGMSFASEAMVSDSFVTDENSLPFDLSSLETRSDSHEIRMPYGMRLDFGGTAKGWAAQQTMRRLSGYGPAMVNAGGDISISGPHADGSSWQIGIIDPLQPEMDLVRLAVPGGGVATSGKDYRKWIRDGVLQHHIIDPRIGEPASTDILTASVYASNVIEAEAAAKVLFILGSDDGGQWLMDHPQIAGLLVMDDGTVRASQTMQNVIWRDHGTRNRTD